MREAIPYLIFDGNCREAMTFYQSCLGGELYMMTFGEAAQKTPPEAKDLLMHARLTNGSTVLMASDNAFEKGYTQGNSSWMCLTCDSNEEVDRLYAALNGGGKDSVAPHDAFWGSYFSMFTDRFGFHWMLSHDRVQQK